MLEKKQREPLQCPKIKKLGLKSEADINFYCKQKCFKKCDKIIKPKKEA